MTRARKAWFTRMAEHVSLAAAANVQIPSNTFAAAVVP